MKRFEILAPAKLNLGLEVIARRPDGFHEIATIFQTIALCDQLTLIHPNDDDEQIVLHVNDPTLEGNDNLAFRAAEEFKATTGVRKSVEILLKKAIPSASGLGGASSDGAATIVGLEQLWEHPLDPAQRQDLAARLGSDVPFFLRGGTAVASGRGDVLEPLLTAIAGCFVVVVPIVTPPIDRKTATLYSALVPASFSDGTTVREQAERLRRGETLRPELLVNAFQSALYALRPEVMAISQHLTASGAPFVALSGAGPAHYTLLPSVEEAESVASRFRSVWPRDPVFCAAAQAASEGETVLFQAG